MLPNYVMERKEDVLPCKLAGEPRKEFEKMGCRCLE